MKEIVGFCGVIGSGKDYKTEIYKKNGFIQVNFAEALKQIIFKTLKIDIKDYNKYEMFKDNYWNPMYKIFPSFNGRDLLQLGNVARKILYEDIWVDAWEKSIKDYDKIVVSDVRYPNEAKKIISLGGQLFFCNYRNNTKYNSKIKLESEQMAQELLTKNFKDGENITQHFIKMFDQVI